VEAHRDELISLAEMKQRSCARAYGYLAAAWAVARNNGRIYSQCLDLAKLNDAALWAIAQLDGKGFPGKAGRDRKLFAAALSPEGLVSTLDSLMDQENIYVLRGETGMGTDIFLERLREAANLRGFDTESLCCPLDPGRPEHLVIPALNLGFFTNSRLWEVEFPARAREINFFDFLDEGVKEYREEIEYNDARFDELAGRTVLTLAAQRKMHDRVEEIYMAGMDFDKLNEACDALIARLMER